MLPLMKGVLNSFWKHVKGDTGNDLKQERLITLLMETSF